MYEHVGAHDDSVSESVLMRGLFGGTDVNAASWA